MEGGGPGLPVSGSGPPPGLLAVEVSLGDLDLAATGNVRRLVDDQLTGVAGRQEQLDRDAVVRDRSLEGQLLAVDDGALSSTEHVADGCELLRRGVAIPRDAERAVLELDTQRAREVRVGDGDEVTVLEVGGSGADDGSHAYLLSLVGTD